MCFSLVDVVFVSSAIFFKDSFRPCPLVRRNEWIHWAHGPTFKTSCSSVCYYLPTSALFSVCLLIPKLFFFFFVIEKAIICKLGIQGVFFSTCWSRSKDNKFRPVHVKPLTKTGPPTIGFPNYLSPFTTFLICYLFIWFRVLSSYFSSAFFFYFL